MALRTPAPGGGLRWRHRSGEWSFRRIIEIPIEVQAYPGDGGDVKGGPATISLPCTSSPPTSCATASPHLRQRLPGAARAAGPRAPHSDRRRGPRAGGTDGRSCPCSAVALAASLLADTVWFLIGRWQGHRVLRTVCRLSLSPDSCVRGTEDLFERAGMPSLLYAKFIPGYNMIAPPLAGAMSKTAVSFLFWDALGSLLWLAQALAARVPLPSRREPGAPAPGGSRLLGRRGAGAGLALVIL